MTDTTLLDGLPPAVRERLVTEIHDRPVTAILAGVGEAILEMGRHGMSRDEIRDKVLREVEDPDTPPIVKQTVTPKVVEIMVAGLIDPSPVDEILAELDATARRPARKRGRR